MRKAPKARASCSRACSTTAATPSARCSGVAPAVPAVERRHALPGSRGGEPGEVRVLRLQAGHRLRPRGGVAHAGLVQLVGAGHPHLLPQHHPHRDLRPLLGHVLVDGVVGEASQLLVGAPEQHLRLVAPAGFQGDAGQATDRLLPVHLVPFPLAPGWRAGGRPTASPLPGRRGSGRGPPRGPRGPPASAPPSRSWASPTPATPAPRRRSPPRTGA